MIIPLPYDLYKNKVVTILGGGESLIGFNFGRVKGEVIAINYSVKNCFNAGMCVGLDSFFFQNNEELFKDYKGILLTDREPKHERAVKVLYETVAMTLGERNLDWHLQSANISGFMALAVALQLRAKKVFLLGFDGGYYKQSNHYYHNSNTSSQEYEKLNYHYEYFKDSPVVNVINPECKSRITYFKTTDINSNFYKS